MVGGRVGVRVCAAVALLSLDMTALSSCTDTTPPELPLCSHRAVIECPAPWIHPLAQG